MWNVIPTLDLDDADVEMKEVGDTTSRGAGSGVGGGGGRELPLQQLVPSILFLVFLISC